MAEADLAREKDDSLCVSMHVFVHVLGQARIPPRGYADLADLSRSDATDGALQRHPNRAIRHPDIITRARDSRLVRDP